MLHTYLVTNIFLGNGAIPIIKNLFCPLDAVHTLTCALMLLNTDLHGQVSSVCVCVCMCAFVCFYAAS